MGGLWGETLLAGIPSPWLIREKGFLVPLPVSLWIFFFQEFIQALSELTQTLGIQSTLFSECPIEGSCIVQIAQRTTPSGCFEAGTCCLPALTLSEEVMLSDAWKPCQSRGLTEQPNTVSRNTRGYYGYFLMLSEGLQTYSPVTTRNTDFPEVPLWAPASKHLLPYKALHLSQRDNTCE